MDIHPITQPELNEFQSLIDASTSEGYKFVQRLWDEHQSGEATFDQAGAVLLGVYEGDQLVAVGGVHEDPYLNTATIGRIRHVYVLPDHRRSGVGRQLVLALMAHGAEQFTVFTLRTLTEHGRAFYESLGFRSTPRFDNATHWFDRSTTPPNPTTR